LAESKYHPQHGGMTTGIIDSSPLFAVSESTEVLVSPEAAYDLVSDLGRSHLWSPECRGGTWVGPPSQVGSVFRGENYRAEDVVGWAPLIRGTWFTEAEVLIADPGRAFQWAMRTHTGRTQRSVWGFAIQPLDQGVRLTHHFEMTHATEGIREIVRELDEEGRVRFVREWGDKLVSDVRVTLSRIKAVLEGADTVAADRSGAVA
jgi:hypothetical protein